jgi:hypothetical protein
MENEEEVCWICGQRYEESGGIKDHVFFCGAQS